MIKIRSSSGVAVNSDRRRKYNDREFSTFELGTIVIDDHVSKRVTPQHHKLVSIASGGQATDWDSLVTLFSPTVKAVAEEFFKQEVPTDLPDDKENNAHYVTNQLKTGWGGMFGVRTYIAWDGSRYGLGVLQFGVMACLVVRMSFETSSVSLKSRLTEGEELPILCAFDSAIADVRAGTPNNKYNIPRQEGRGVVYKAMPFGKFGMLWIPNDSIPTKQMGEKEFWTFLRASYYAQREDNKKGKPPPPNNRTATWFSSPDAEVLKTLFKDSTEEQRISVYQAIAPLL